MLRYQYFGCVNFFSFDVEVQEICGNCVAVFGKNWKYRFYLDVRHFIEFCYPRNKVKQIFKCLRRIDFSQVLQIFSFGNPLQLSQKETLKV